MELFYLIAVTCATVIAPVATPTQVATCAAVAALLAESWQWLADTAPEREAAAFKAQLAASVHTLKQVEQRLQP